MPKASTEDIERLVNDLDADAESSLNYLFLTVSACAIATMGLLSNSTAVIIGAMIIAPLMMPLRGLALAALEGNFQMVSKSLTTVGIGTLVAVVMAWMVGRIVGLPASEFGREILSRTQPNLADLGVAIAAGAVSGFAKIRPQISDALAGTAISVALMPPLCVVGITLSQGSWSQSGGAFLLYFTNLLGITLACMLVFAWGGYYLKPSRMRWALRGALFMTSLLVIPLFASLWLLLKRVELQSTIRELLETQTITVGRQTELIDMDVNWNLLSNQPPEVILTVQARESVTPKQVGEVEAFLYSKLKQRFKLLFRVSEFREVQSGEFEETSASPQPRSQTNPN
ncbi:MAG: DUF389 domain-containing protein [Symploca sp. SIO2E9]|nr:DUF389 domain-containing protein [Symploca sp. SIO2E9]